MLFKGNLAVVQTLLAKGADVNAHRSDGITALMMASQAGSLEVVQTLIDQGGDIHAKTSDGATALTLASKNGHLDVEQLLESAATSETKPGRTPLLN